ncbi:MAG TPA: biotin/lipoyl-containing protein [Mucilaginibacter sp.]|nr:biotin/lipoyl-containing protein [Mucilaginibacter sp.]
MYKLNVNEQFDFEIGRKEDILLVNDQEVTPDIRQLNSSAFHVIDNLRSYNVEVVNYDPAAKTAEIQVNSNIYKVTGKNEFDILLDQLGLSNLNSAKVSEIKAPMPGLVLKVFVEQGTEVKKGDNLFVLEAMKMENIIKAPADVVVKTIKIKPGDKVEKGQVLMMF